MLKNLSENKTNVGIPISKAYFPEPFKSSLEYNAPARGTWNIVHTGMLIPESHQIFACAQGCLRGVILTAAEMNAMDRMSWISVEENDMFDATMESDIVDGVTDILNRLERLPPCVLIFISCIHQFAGIDFDEVIEELSNKFLNVKFIDCYMNPTMRKSGLTPDQIMRCKLYSGLSPSKQDKKTINIIGNDRQTSPSSELLKMLRDNGFLIQDITLCKTYEDYKKLSNSLYNITYLPQAFAAGENLENALSQKQIYIPLSYDFDEIKENYTKLANTLGFSLPSLDYYSLSAYNSLINAKNIIGDAPIQIDYTATSRPLGLAKLLLNHGYNVTAIYADVFIGEEEATFNYLKENYPNTIIYPTVNTQMRFFANEHANDKVLAIGQKAAYFSSTKHFVNIVAGGGFYGYDGISQLCKLMIDAYVNEKDTETVISHKGLGCESCL